MKIKAFDKVGNTFVKNVIFHDGLIDFGGWATYNAKGLIERFDDWKKEKRNFCIDMGGFNHKGSPVYISNRSICKIIKYAKAVLEKKIQKVLLEVSVLDDDICFNIIFPNTGEIRQKRRSKQWFMDRVFMNEFKGNYKKYGEILEIEQKD
jgi:hypothetical protein